MAAESGQKMRCRVERASYSRCGQPSKPLFGVIRRYPSDSPSYLLSRLPYKDNGILVIATWLQTLGTISTANIEGVPDTLPRKMSARCTISPLLLYFIHVMPVINIESASYNVVSGEGRS